MEVRQTFMERTVRATVRATAEVYFPKNDFGAPDWEDTDMVERTVQYLKDIPPSARPLLYVLFVAVEWAAPFLLAGVGRFSKRSLPFRERAIRRWNTWNFIVFRVLSEGLKAQLTMTYVSHPLVQKRMGVWKSCEREADPYNFPVRHGFLEQFAADDAAAREVEP